MNASGGLLGMLIVTAGVAAYANGLPGAFLFDDRTNIVLNARIRTLPPGEPVPVTSLRRPVVRWSFAVNCALGGLDPRGYRATNVAIHVLAALCLFGVVHPLQTESVTYSSQRLEALVGLCLLGGLYALALGGGPRSGTATTGTSSACGRTSWPAPRTMRAPTATWDSCS